MLLKYCTQYARKTQHWPQGWKSSVLIPIPKQDSAKGCTNYCTTVFISHASKDMLKILQARLQQYMNWELPDVQAGFRKGKGTRDQIANICWIIQKAREFQKNIYSASWTTLKPLWITANCGKFLEMGMPDHLTCLLRKLYADQETTEPDMNNWLVPNWESSMTRLCIVTLLI